MRNRWIGLAGSKMIGNLLSNSLQELQFETQEELDALLPSVLDRAIKAQF